MSSASWVVSAALVGAITTTPVLGLAADDAAFFGPEHRRKIYESRKKSVGEALLYTALLPPLGDFYAEQYGWGAINGALLVFALTFVGYGAATDQSEFYVWGGVTAATSYVLAGVTATLGVNAYNTDLRAALKVGEFGAIERAPGLTFSWAF